jgi:hypothetical protein
MLNGEAPFHSEEPMIMYEKILHQEIKFPKNMDKYCNIYIEIFW